MYKNTLHLILLVSVLLNVQGCAFMKAYSRNYTLESKPRFAKVNEVNKGSLREGTLSVVSFNIKEAERIERAAYVLKKYGMNDADIICLQEMDEAGVKYMSEKLGYNYVYYPSSIKDDKNFGNAVLSKWPIVYDQKVILPHLDTRMMQRIAVVAVVEVMDKQLMVVSTHFGVNIFPNQRGDQADAIIRSIPPHIHHIIIGGDFNALTDVHQRALLEPFIEEHFVISTKNVDWTYKHWYLFNKKSKLDYILSRGMRVMDSGKISDRSASDHTPIWATFKFSEFIK